MPFANVGVLENAVALQSFTPTTLTTRLPTVPVSLATIDELIPSQHNDYTSQPRAYGLELPECYSEEVEKIINKDGQGQPTTTVNVPSVTHSPEEREMKQLKTKCTIGFLSTLIAYVSLNSWIKSTYPNAFVWCDEDREEASWVATSKSWFDRKACRWLSICGGQHMHFAHNPFGRRVHHARQPNQTNHFDPRKEWTTKFFPSPSEDKHSRDIPNYVMEYAPLVHLYSEEQFWPCDLAEHLFHTTPFLNYTQIQSEDEHPELVDLGKLNQWQRGYDVFLTSNDNVEERPKWLEGAKNIPDNVSAENALLDDNEGWIHHPARTHLQGLKDAASILSEDSDNEVDADKQSTIGDATYTKGQAQSLLDQELKRRSDRYTLEPYKHKIKGGRSSAPAILITVAKPGGVLDAFWFFFYSFNLGNSVLGLRFGNHVGDWEHTAVRFKYGKPQAVYFSEHDFGSAYSYEAVEKLGKRPVIYSAIGTHAMYATPGSHYYGLPGGLLRDRTDRGPLWDPALNHHSYTYNHKTETLLASNLTLKSPTSWFDFAGHWGDKFYPLGDKRQYRLFGQYHYVNGPLGPKFKNLEREQICGGPDGTPCVIKQWLPDEEQIRWVRGNGVEADEWSAAHKARLQFDLK